MHDNGDRITGRSMMTISRFLLPAFRKTKNYRWSTFPLLLTLGFKQHLAPAPQFQCWQRARERFKKKVAWRSYFLNIEIWGLGEGKCCLNSSVNRPDVQKMSRLPVRIRGHWVQVFLRAYGHSCILIHTNTFVHSSLVCSHLAPAVCKSAVQKRVNQPCTRD